jgi:hypothetical protein
VAAAQQHAKEVEEERARLRADLQVVKYLLYWY